MSVEAVTKAGGFTDEILAKNFVAIGKEFNSIAQWQRHIEDHVSELYDMAQGAGSAIKQLQKPSGIPTKYKVIVGVAVGLYLGRRTMTNEFNKRMEQVKREAKEQFDNFVASQKNDTSAPKAPAETEFRGNI